MKNLNKLLGILCVLFSIVLLPCKTYAIDEVSSLSTDETLKIEKFIKENMDKGNIPGLSVTIVSDDKTIYQKGFGYSDIEEKKPVDSKTLFEIGSNSKAFTALGILNLQKEGVIKLDDEVTKYIPWLKVKFKGNEAKITIEQLLHHTSGIPFKTIDKIPVSDEENSLEDTIKTLVDIGLDSMPGEKYQYATINYDVLGFIIEKATGISYEKYIEEKVLNTMKLNNTFLYRNDVNSSNMAQGYKVGFFKPQVYDAPNYRGNKPAGYIISNAKDMAKWLKIQMGTSGSAEVGKELIEDSHKPNRRVAPLNDGSSYAAGWFVYQKGGGEISHGGNNPNYSSYIVFRPEDRVGVGVLSNINSDYVSEIGQGINDILQDKYHIKDIKDLNKSADKISVFIICCSSLIIISFLFFLLKAIKEVLKKERVFCKKGKKFFIKLGFSLIFIVGLSYSIYLIPYILYEGVSWGFVFVWLPKTIKIALYLVYISICLVYTYSIFTSIYKKKDENSVLLLSMISVVSGFGNALIIFTINLGIGSSNPMKIKLLVYFIIGIILYVYGQKLVRVKLIEVTNGIVYSKRIEIIRCLLKASYKNFEDIEKGIIESTLNNDTETISRFANILIGGITSTITLICCFAYLGFINKHALLFSMIIILLIAGIYYLVGRYADKIGEEARDIQGIFFKFINDLIGGFKELSLNQKRKNEFEEDMRNCCEEYKVKRSKSALAFGNMFVIGELLFTLAIGAMALIIPLILKGLESTSVASYVFILLYMTGPVHGILETIPNVIEVRISLKRIDSLLSQIPDLKDEECDKYQFVNNANNVLMLNEIEYIYDKSDDKSFKVGPISYEFNSGEIVFITGGNGSGKSTLAKLISGLYQPSRGYITLNNKDISQKQLSENYSTVFSDFYLFDKLYGMDYKHKEKEIQKYLEILQLDKKVQIKEGKFSTTKLSTGQKKRLALLVTYLEDRPIYLFDEWAADQDPEFRLFFYNTLLPGLKKDGKCIIAITHDDHYFSLADKVIKMEMGTIK